MDLMLPLPLGPFGSFGGMTLHMRVWSSQAGTDSSAFSATLEMEPLDKIGLLVLDAFFCERADQRQLDHLCSSLAFSSNQ